MIQYHFSFEYFQKATKETSSLWGKIDFEAPIIKPDGPSSAEKPPQFDKKLNLTILPPAPALHVSFTQIPVEVLAGEIIPITVYLTNAGAVSLNDIWVVGDEPRWILGEPNSQELPLSLLRGKFTLKFTLDGIPKSQLHTNTVGSSVSF